MIETPLDVAHAAMMAAPDDDALRLRFYERLADNELFLLLEEDAVGDNIRPRVFPLEDGPVVLVFDREDRLTDFAAGSVPFAAMSGRVVVELLDGQGLDLGVNLDVAPSAIVIPAAALTWLNRTLGHVPAEVSETPEEIDAPTGLPEQLLTGLDTKLATAGGLAHLAYLCAVRYASGRRTHLLAFIDPVPGAEPALARAAGQALTFSGVEAGEMDVAFFRASDPVAAKLSRVGLRFDLPKAEPVQKSAGPGMDSQQPPILR
jgi:hypothetical protein